MKHKIERKKPFRAYFALMAVKRGTMIGPTGEQIEVRVPEGYGFVNEWVGDGYNLKRSSMVAATEDYMSWGAVREMHQPSAVGTALGRVTVTDADGNAEELDLGVSWDAKGAWLRTAVVGTEAILKLDAGVYKGYSVGIRATVMRGQDVEACTWIENSLVDRPADPDARIEIIRALHADPEAEADVLRYWDENDRWVDEAWTFAGAVDQLRDEDKRSDLFTAVYLLVESWRSIQKKKADASLLGQSFDEFAAYVKSDILGEMDAARAAGLDAALTRFEALRTADASLATITRQQTQAQTDLEAVRAQLTGTTQQVQTLTSEAQGLRVERDAARAELESAQAEVTRLGKLPDPSQQRPVRFAGVERTFAVNENESDQHKEALETIARLQKEAQNPQLPDADRQRIATEIMRAQSSLQGHI